MQKNNVKIQNGRESKPRESNLELFRIITMLLIVAHHYVVNSGLMAAEGPMKANPQAWQTVFLWVFGGWGKLGINCFVLITGYFMCKSRITAKKYAKLLFEVEFYRIVFYLLFAVTGRVQFSVFGFLSAINPFPSIAQGFTSCFLLFYLLMPFLNILLHNMNEKQHAYLLLLLCGIYVLLGTALGGGVVFNYVTWFVVLYVIAAYIRLYPKAIFQSAKIWGILAMLSVVGTVICIVGCHFVGMKIKAINGYSFMVDSNKIVSVVTAFCLFMFFKNVKIKPSKFINTVAASTFGVLLIHSNSATMRRFLWIDFLKVVKMYSSPLLILHAVACVLGIFVVCIAIDHLRIRFLEKPFFRLWDKHWDKIANWYVRKEERLCQKLGIDTTEK